MTSGDEAWKKSLQLVVEELAASGWVASVGKVRANVHHALVGDDAAVASTLSNLAAMGDGRAAALLPHVLGKRTAAQRVVQRHPQQVALALAVVSEKVPNSFASKDALQLVVVPAGCFKEGTFAQVSLRGVDVPTSSSSGKAAAATVAEALGGNMRTRRGKHKGAVAHPDPCVGCLVAMSVTVPAASAGSHQRVPPLLLLAALAGPPAAPAASAPPSWREALLEGAPRFVAAAGGSLPADAVALHPLVPRQGEATHARLRVLASTILLHYETPGRSRWLDALRAVYPKQRIPAVELAVACAAFHGWVSVEEGAAVVAAATRLPAAAVESYRCLVTGGFALSRALGLLPRRPSDSKCGWGGGASPTPEGRIAANARRKGWVDAEHGPLPAALRCLAGRKIVAGSPPTAGQEAGGTVWWPITEVAPARSILRLLSPEAIGGGGGGGGGGGVAAAAARPAVHPTRQGWLAAYNPPAAVADAVAAAAGDAVASTTAAVVVLYPGGAGWDVAAGVAAAFSPQATVVVTPTGSFAAAAAAAAAAAGEEGRESGGGAHVLAPNDVRGLAALAAGPRRSPVPGGKVGSTAVSTAEEAFKVLLGGLRAVVVLEAGGTPWTATHDLLVLARTAGGNRNQIRLVVVADPACGDEAPAQHKWLHSVGLVQGGSPLRRRREGKEAAEETLLRVAAMWLHPSVRGVSVVAAPRPAAPHAAFGSPAHGHRQPPPTVAAAGIPRKLADGTKVRVVEAPAGGWHAAGKAAVAAYAKHWQGGVVVVVVPEVPATPGGGGCAVRINKECLVASAGRGVSKRSLFPGSVARVTSPPLDVAGAASGGRSVRKRRAAMDDDEEEGGGRGRSVGAAFVAEAKEVSDEDSDDGRDPLGVRGSRFCLPEGAVCVVEEVRHANPRLGASAVPLISWGVKLAHGDVRQAKLSGGGGGGGGEGWVDVPEGRLVRQAVVSPVEVATRRKAFKHVVLLVVLPAGAPPRAPVWALNAACKAAASGRVTVVLGWGGGEEDAASTATKKGEDGSR